MRKGGHKKKDEKTKEENARDTERCFNTKSYAVSRLKSVEGEM